MPEHAASSVALLREGARALLARAVEAEVAAFLAHHAEDEPDPVGDGEVLQGVPAGIVEHEDDDAVAPGGQPYSVSLLRLRAPRTMTVLDVIGG
jgi:hypothetical protein